MAKAFKNFWAAAIMIMAALFVFGSCNGSLDEINDHSRVLGRGIEDIAEPGDKYITTIGVGTVTFTETGKQFGAEYFEVYQTPEGEEKRVPVFSASRYLDPSHHGDDPQHYDWRSEYATSRGDVKTTSSEELKAGEHFSYFNDTTIINWVAVNKDGESFVHQTVTTAPRDVKCVWYCEKENRDIVIDFPNSKVEWSEKTTHTDVSGVPYQGKFWDAVMYLSRVPAKETLSTGETKEYVAENVTYLLKHVVTSKLEKKGFEARFYEANGDVLTEYERNHVDIVVMDNNDVTDRQSYALEAELYRKTSNRFHDIYVDNEADLYPEEGTFNQGKYTSSSTQKEVFTLVTNSATSTYTVAGQSITRNFQYQRYQYGSEQLPYGYFVEGKPAFKVELNKELTTSAQKVTTVTVTFPDQVKFDGVSRSAEDYTDVNTFNIIYRVPDDYTHEWGKKDYDVALYVNSTKDSLLTRKQVVSAEYKTLNRGELVNTEPITKNLNFKVGVGTLNDVKVSSEAMLKNKTITFEHATDFTTTTTSGEPISVKTYTLNEKAVLPDGQVIPVYELFQQAYAGAEKFPYAAIDDVVATVEVKRNDARCTSSMEFWTVTVTFTVKVKYENSEKKADEYKLIVEYDRYYNIPDNFTYEDKDFTYVFNYQVNQAKDELVSTAQENSWKTYCYNNGVYQEELTETHLIDKMPAGVQVSVDGPVSIEKGQRGKEVTVKSTDLGVATSKDKTDYIEKGITLREYNQTSTFTLSDKHKVTVYRYWSELRKDGKVILTRTVLNDPRIQEITTPSQIPSNGDVEAFAYKVKVATEMVETEAAQTRAPGASKTEVLEVSPQQTYTDKVVRERIDTTITSTATGFHWVLKAMVTYDSKDEEVQYDSKEGDYVLSLTGIDGTSMEVSNATFAQEGAGYKGTGNGTYNQPATNGKDTLNSKFSWRADRNVTASLNFPSGVKTVTIPATWEIKDLDPTITPTGSANGFDTYRFSGRVQGISTLGGKSKTLSATANTELKVKKSNNLLRKWNEPSVKPNGQGYDISVVFYEEYELDGVKSKTLDDKMGRGFDPEHTDDLQVSEYSTPQTTSNGASGGARGTYSSTTKVGNKSRNNVRSYWYDEVKTISYNGQSVTFRGSATFSEVSSTVGSATVQGTNNVYPFTNKAQMVYTVRWDDKSTSETIANEVNWNIIVPVPDNIPDLIPGKIRFAAGTYLPGHATDQAGTMFADGRDTQQAIAEFTIISDQVGVVIPFSPWNKSEDAPLQKAPTEEQIRNANFVYGSFTSEYNSGYDPKQDGMWIPAKGENTSKGIGYALPREDKPEEWDYVRSIRKETLNQWNWRDKNYSLNLDGYTFEVDANGVLTVRYKGDVVLQCK